MFPDLTLQFLGYVIASLDLAHEYALLGKYKRAANIFNQALDIVRSGQVPEEVSISFLLRYAELLALVEDVPKRYQFCDSLFVSNILIFLIIARRYIWRLWSVPNSLTWNAMPPRLSNAFIRELGCWNLLLRLLMSLG